MEMTAVEGDRYSDEQDLKDRLVKMCHIFEYWQIYGQKYCMLHPFVDSSQSPVECE
jgi:hypothetical protein